MNKTRFFVCPVCGSLSFCTGPSSVSCCGRPLEALEPKKAAPEQALRVTDSDGDWYVESDHPARKDDYISFLALVTGEKLLVLRQYPEWEIHARLPGRPHGRLVWYSHHPGPVLSAGVGTPPPPIGGGGALIQREPLTGPVPMVPSTGQSRGAPFSPSSSR